MTPADLWAAVTTLVKGQRPFSAKHFVVAVSTETRGTQFALTGHAENQLRPARVCLVGYARPSMVPWVAVRVGKMLTYGSQP